VGQTRAQDSFQFRVSYDLLLGAANAPSFYAFFRTASDFIGRSNDPFF
jgi:hypothetical protein